MGGNRWLTRGSFLLCAVGVAVIVIFSLMNKDGGFDGGRLAEGQVSYNILFLALTCAPLVALASLCVLRRPNRSLAIVGLIACAIAAGASAWGVVTDFKSWSDRPPPTDQITYLGWFFGMLVGWGVYLVYGVIGWVMRLKKPGAGGVAAS